MKKHAVISSFYRLATGMCLTLAVPNSSMALDREIVYQSLGFRTISEYDELLSKCLDPIPELTESFKQALVDGRYFGIVPAEAARCVTLLQNPAYGDVPKSPAP